MLTGLRPYQEEAVDMAVERGSALIAYEMGLGKTICALAICEEVMGHDDGTVAAIVVPANLKWQWAQEIAKHTDVDTTTKKIRLNGESHDITIPRDHHAIVIDGDRDKRRKQLRYVMAERPPYVILGYENVVNDWRLVSRVKPDIIVLDEATAIKTFKANRTKQIKRWTAPVRVALTGSPIENGKPEEIFSIMEWVDAKVLGRYDLFDKAFITRNQYGAVVRYKNMPVLNRKLSSVMSRKRRTDPDVAPYLPAVTETTEWVAVDKPTRDAYKAIGKDLLEALAKAREKTVNDFDLFSHYHGGGDAGGSKEAGEVMARMLAIEMLLNHPDLVRQSASEYEDNARRRKEGEERATWSGSKYASQVVRNGVLDTVKTSPKMDRLVDRIAEIATGNPVNKVVVFSFHRRACAIIEQRLAEVGVGSVSYHGEMTASQKVGAVAKFRNEPDTRVIICSHAAAFGTDLNMANYLINFDLPWSAGTMDQINARHVRASSKFKNVYIINMLCENTIEARKPEVLAHKRRTASAVVDGKGADIRGRVENSVATLTDFLTRTL